jgi:hypothetical protein
MTRTRTVPDRQALSDAVDDYKRDGYSIDSHDDTRAVVTYRDHGGLLAHGLLALFGWWTLGLANLAYALWRRHSTADRVEVVVDER